MKHPALREWRTFAATVIVMALTCGVALMVRSGRTPQQLNGLGELSVYGVLFALFLAAAWLVRGVPRRRAAVLILLGGIALQAVAATAPPRTSDDLYRYVWDGRVQAAGIDPYRYVPAAPELVGFRDATLWPSSGAGWCVPPGTPDAVTGCTLINRPTVHTIYPPVAEAYFFAVHELPGVGAWGPSGVQAAAGVLAAAVTVLLLFGLRRIGRDPRTAALWAWCPTVALEAGNGGHVDVFAVFLTGCAMLLLARGRVVRGGLLLGLAVATKVTPVLAVPGSLRRRPLAFLGAVFGPVVVVYLPHVVAVGSGVSGFLGGYLREEGYDDGKRFALLSKMLPEVLVKPGAVAVLAVVAGWVWWRASRGDAPGDDGGGERGDAGGSGDHERNGDAGVGGEHGRGAGGKHDGSSGAGNNRDGTATRPEPWRGALVMTGAAMLVAAPAYPWYAMLLVLFVAFEGWSAVPWLSVAFAGYVVATSLGAAYGYGGAALVVGLSYAWPAWRARHTRQANSEKRPIGSHPIRGQTTLNTSSRVIQPPVKIRTAKSTSSEQPPGVSVTRANVTQLDVTRLSGARVDVILPCLDEAGALPYVLGRMPPGYHPIVVDNGSTDASVETALRLGAQVVHEPRRGFGAACHAGLEAATADVVCFLDCDGSFDPQDLPQVAEPILQGRADLLLGQRRPVSRSAWPPHARFANRVLARRIRRATGVRIHDLGPMRAAPRELLLNLDVRDRRFGYPLEMVLKAAAEGWRIEEVDVPYSPRTGKSKVTGTVRGTAKAVRDMRRVWKAATE